MPAETNRSGAQPQQAIINWPLGMLNFNSEASPAAL